MLQLRRWYSRAAGVHPDVRETVYIHADQRGLHSDDHDEELLSENAESKQTSLSLSCTAMLYVLIILYYIHVDMYIYIYMPHKGRST